MSILIGGIEMKRFIEGESRTQSTLLPETLDDYIADTNPVRVVDEVPAARFSCFQRFGETRSVFSSSRGGCMNTLGMATGLPSGSTYATGFLPMRLSSGA